MKVNFVGSASAEIKNVVRKSVSETMKFLGQTMNSLEVCVSFMTKEDMRELNKRTRNIDKVTDVLSYPAFTLTAGELIDCGDPNICYSGAIHIGDMAICLEQAAVQAKEYGTTFLEEVSKLAVHSTFHLMGYDHIEDKDFIIMQPKEEKVRGILKSKKII